MKKSKLLIPALSVASVGAVVAPMVTSCANGNAVDLLTYESQIARLSDPDKKLVDKKDEAVKKYFGATNVNEIIRNDMLTHLANNVDVLRTMMSEISSELIKFLGIDYLGAFTLATAEVKNINVEYSSGLNAQMSGYIDLKLNAKIVDNPVSMKVIGNYSLELSYDIKKIPYTFLVGTYKYKDGQTEKTVYPYEVQVSNTISTDKNWSGSVYYKGEAVYKNGDPTESESEKFSINYENYTSSYGVLFGALNFYSDYLGDIVNTKVS